MADDTPIIVPLRTIPMRVVKPWDSASQTVLQLAHAHMIGGLRVANRLRDERGQPAYTAEEVLAILGLETS